MNINFELYRVFYTVAKIGSITNAAKELMITQPAISKAIKNLEEQIGGQLFVRTKHGVVLTEEGKEFYSYIKQAMEIITSAENKFSDLINLETGIIRIGVSTTLVKEFLLPYLEVFHKRYPKIEIKIFTNMASESLSMLKDGLLDLVIINMPANEDKTIKIIPLKEIQDCFIVGEAYKNLKDKELSLNDLSKFPLVFQLRGSNTRSFLDKFLESKNVVLRPNMELSSYTLVTEFTKAGFGVGYATLDYIEEYLKLGVLYKLNVKEEIPKRHIGLAYSTRTLPSFSTRKFMELLKEKDLSIKGI